MKFVIPLFLAIVALLLSCNADKKGHGAGMGSTALDLGDNEDKTLRDVKILDTTYNIYEYSKEDQLGRRQGMIYSLTLDKQDTFRKFFYFNDTLLNYIWRYNNNKVYEIVLPSVLGDAIQEWRYIDSLGNVDFSNSCFVDWNHDLSKIIETENDSIVFIGRLLCNDKPIYGCRVAQFINGSYSDTINISNELVPHYKFKLKRGLNRIGLFYSSASFRPPSLDTITSLDTFWLDRSYVAFVRRI